MTKKGLSLRNRILPGKVSHSYRGLPFAKWAFGAVTLVTILRSLLHIFLPDGGAESIATIPLSGYSPEAADAVIHLFALWGISQLLLGIVFILVFLKYSGLIPLMYLLIFIEYASRLLVAVFKPMELAGTAPGGVGNYVLVPVSLFLFVLSVIRPRRQDQTIE